MTDFLTMSYNGYYVNFRVKAKARGNRETGKQAKIKKARKDNSLFFSYSYMIGIYRSFRFISI